MSNLGGQFEGDKLCGGVGGSEVTVDLGLHDLLHDVQGSRE